MADCGTSQPPKLISISLSLTIYLSIYLSSIYLPTGSVSLENPDSCRRDIYSSFCACLKSGVKASPPLSELSTEAGWGELSHSLSRCWGDEGEERESRKSQGSILGRILVGEAGNLTAWWPVFVGKYTLPLHVSWALGLIFSVQVEFQSLLEQRILGQKQKHVTNFYGSHPWNFNYLIFTLLHIYIS